MGCFGIVSLQLNSLSLPFVAVSFLFLSFPLSPSLSLSHARTFPSSSLSFGPFNCSTLSMLPFNFHLIVGFFLFYSFSLCVYLFVRMIEIWKRVKKSPLSYAHQRYIIYEIPLLFLQYFFLSLLSKTRNRENERDNSATILLTRIRHYENNGIIFMKIISNNLLPLF